MVSELTQVEGFLRGDGFLVRAEEKEKKNDWGEQDWVINKEEK